MWESIEIKGYKDIGELQSNTATPTHSTHSTPSTHSTHSTTTTTTTTTRTTTTTTSTTTTTTTTSCNLGVPNSAPCETREWTNKKWDIALGSSIPCQ